LVYNYTIIVQCTVQKKAKKNALESIINQHNEIRLIKTAYLLSSLKVAQT